MKQIWMIVVVVLCVIGFSSMGFTQDFRCPMAAAAKDVHQGQQICPWSQGTGHGHGCGIMGRSMVATPDGGVIVMCCNKLFKYDQNLVLMKEVEVKMTGMPKCPMSEQMKTKGPAAPTK